LLIVYQCTLATPSSRALTRRPDCLLIVYRYTSRPSIEDLAEHGDMVDCSHLLLRGTLPTRAERRAFTREARSHRMARPHTAS